MLGGRDLQRVGQGTWFGVTRDGRFAGLTNFREQTEHIVSAPRSRGEIAKSVLSSSSKEAATTEDMIDNVLGETDVSQVGGFSLLCGRFQRQDAVLKGGDDMLIVSNRTTSEQGPVRLSAKPGQTYALGNAPYGDRSWSKVVSGEKMLRQCLLVHSALGESRVELVERLFALLGTDTFPISASRTWDETVSRLKDSIFIPRLNKDSDTVTYGTVSQTVLLVDQSGHVTFVEQTPPCPLDVGSVRKDRVSFEFDIEGW